MMEHARPERQTIYKVASAAVMDGLPEKVWFFAPEEPGIAMDGEAGLFYLAAWMEEHKVHGYDGVLCQDMTGLDRARVTALLRLEWQPVAEKAVPEVMFTDRDAADFRAEGMSWARVEVASKDLAQFARGFAGFGAITREDIEDSVKMLVPETH